MRLLIDTLVAAMLAALLGGILTYQQRQEDAQRDVETLRLNVRQIQQQVMFRAALEDTPRNEFGYPATVDPEWFGEKPPLNPLLSLRHPWLEIAGPEEWALDHPRIKAATESTFAMFWYNPRRGVVRARVPHRVSDERTIELYNFVNDSSVPGLYGLAPDLIGDDFSGGSWADAAAPVGEAERSLDQAMRQLGVGYSATSGMPMMGAAGGTRGMAAGRLSSGGGDQPRMEIKVNRRRSSARSSASSSNANTSIGGGKDPGR